jgi:thiol-disulfide isomerase/thioredoxin
MLKKILLVPITMLLLMAVSCGAGDNAAAEKSAPVKSQAKEAVTMISTLSPSFFEGKVTFIELWGVWCPPCIRSMPHVEEVWQHNKDNPNFQMMVVNTGWRGDTPAKVKGWLDKNPKYTFPVYFEDRAQPQQLAAEHKVTSIPRSIILDKKGEVAYNGHPMQIPATLLAELFAQ